MPRQPRVDLPNFWYHAIAKSQPSKDLFIDDLDRQNYLTLLNETLLRSKALCGAFVLLTTHLHLLLFRTAVTLGDIFRSVHMNYTTLYNKRHRTRGKLFYDRPFTRIVLNDRYLGALLNYLHCKNPLGAGLAQTPEEYAWSSDRFYRYGETFPFVYLTPVPGFEGESGKIRYKMLVEESNFDFELISQASHFIGTEEEFSQIDSRQPGRGWKRFERRGKSPISDRVLELVLDKDLIELLRSPAKTAEIVKKRARLYSILHREGYLVTEIAAYFNRSMALVLRAMKKHEEGKK